MNHRYWKKAIAVSAVLSIVGVAGFVTSGNRASGAGGIPSGTSIVASPSTANFGHPVTLTANVSSIGLGTLVIPSGTVTFVGPGGLNLGTATITSPCLLTIIPCDASITTTALPVGTDTVTANYSGDVLSSTSSGTTTVTVISTRPSPPVLTVTPQPGDNYLSWTVPNDGGSPITGYNVYRSTASGSETIFVSGFHQTSYQDDAVDPSGSTTYYYEVTAVNANGESAKSNEASGTPQSLAAESTMTCSSGSTCTAPQLTVTDGTPGTDFTTLQVTSSTGTDVITESLGGNGLTSGACPNASGDTAPWATFNDTAGAGKVVEYDLFGKDSHNLYNNQYVTNGSRLLCLGMPQPWEGVVGGVQHQQAVFNPADGLYEASIGACVNTYAICYNLLVDGVHVPADFMKVTIHFPAGSGDPKLGH